MMVELSLSNCFSGYNLHLKLGTREIVCKISSWSTLREDLFAALILKLMFPEGQWQAIL